MFIGVNWTRDIGSYFVDGIKDFKTPPGMAKISFVWKIGLIFTNHRRHLMINGPVGSNHGNLGPCPRPWRRVVTDPSKHRYLPRLGDCATQ